MNFVLEGTLDIYFNKYFILHKIKFLLAIRERLQFPAYSIKTSMARLLRSFGINMGGVIFSFYRIPEDVQK